MKKKLFKVEECYLPQTMTISSFHTSLNKKKAECDIYISKWFSFFTAAKEKKNLHKRSIGTSLSPDMRERACVHVCEKENWNELIYRDSKWKACQIFLNSQTLFFPFSFSTAMRQYMTTEQHKPAVHHNAVSLSYTPLLIFAFHYHALILPLSLHLLSLLSYVTEPF